MLSALSQFFSEFILRLSRQVARVLRLLESGLVSRLLTLYDLQSLLRTYVRVEDVHVFFQGATQHEIVGDFRLGASGTVELPCFTSL